MPEEFQLFSSLRYDKKLLDVPASGFAQAGWNHENTSPFYMLDYHRDRILRAATYWGWNPAIKAIAGPEGLENLESFLTKNLESGPAPLRVKVTLTKDGELGVESNNVPEQSLANLFPSQALPQDIEDAVQGSLGVLEREPVYEVYLDQDPTHRSEYTHYKTTKRAMYDGARKRAGIALTDTKEVLLVNQDDGTVMEGSTTTPYFFRGGRWVTPPVSRQYNAEAGSGGQDGTTRRWALERGLAIEEKVEASSVVPGESVWLSNGVRGFLFGRIKLIN